MVQCWNWRGGATVFGPIPTPSEPVAATYTPEGNHVLVLCAIQANALGFFDANIYRFELTDAQERHFTPQSPVSYSLVPTWRVTDSLLLSGGLISGGVASLPWNGIALRPVPLGQSPRLLQSLVFVRPKGAGPPARLILNAIRRVKAEIPFEFRDLPLP
jgi:hypothetical protein